MATSKKMTETVPAPVVLAGCGTTELAGAEFVTTGARRMRRGNGKMLSKTAVDGIYQNHQCDMAIPETEPKIVLL